MGKIGIIGAMEEEVIMLKQMIDLTEVRSVVSYEFFVGTLNNKEVVVVKGGVGKVNSALCTQLLIDCFSIDAIINTGMAGALSDALNIGDIVISKDAIQHDMDARGFGYPIGQVPRMPVTSFRADAALIDFAKRASEYIDVQYNVFVERVLSGDQFVSSVQKKKELIDTFDGFCAEMEGAAIAQVCFVNRVPFVIIRSISDKADASAHVNIKEFTQVSATNTCKIITNMLRIM